MNHARACVWVGGTKIFFDQRILQSYCSWRKIPNSVKNRSDAPRVQHALGRMHTPNTRTPRKNNTASTCTSPPSPCPSKNRTANTALPLFVLGRTPDGCTQNVHTTGARTVRSQRASEHTHQHTDAEHLLAHAQRHRALPSPEHEARPALLHKHPLPAFGRRHRHLCRETQKEPQQNRTTALPAHTTEAHRATASTARSHS